MVVGTKTSITEFGSSSDVDNLPSLFTKSMKPLSPPLNKIIGNFWII